MKFWYPFPTLGMDESKHFRFNSLIEMAHTSLTTLPGHMTFFKFLFGKDEVRQVNFKFRD